MTAALLKAFPSLRDLQALGPEDLAGVLIEILPQVSQGGRFLLDSFVAPFFSIHGEGYPPAQKGEVAFLIAEAFAWLVTHDLIIPEPDQPAPWHRLTRLGKSLKTRQDLAEYQKGRALPLDLLQQRLREKVHGLFLRGDHATAVFQAFKEVEIAVRKAGNFPDDLVGQKLIAAAFNPKNGKLRDENLIEDEQQAEFQLFAGAIGHAKNPGSHRDVFITRQQAARLIIFASHLLDIVEERKA